MPLHLIGAEQLRSQRRFFVGVFPERVDATEARRDFEQSFEKRLLARVQLWNPLLCGRNGVAAVPQVVPTRTGAGDDSRVTSTALVPDRLYFAHVACHGDRDECNQDGNIRNNAGMQALAEDTGPHRSRPFGSVHSARQCPPRFMALPVRHDTLSIQRGKGSRSRALPHRRQAGRVVVCQHHPMLGAMGVVHGC
jgi:hypothetical protein